MMGTYGNYNYLGKTFQGFSACKSRKAGGEGVGAGSVSGGNERERVSVCV